MSNDMTDQEIRRVVEEFVEKFVIPRMDDRGKEIVEQALNEIVMPKLSKIDGLSGEIQSNADRIAEHDVVIEGIRNEQAVMLSEIRSLPETFRETIQGVVRGELHAAATARDAERYRELQKIGRRMIVAVAGSSGAMALIIRVVFGG